MSAEDKVHELTDKTSVSSRHSCKGGQNRVLKM